jgi:SpoVK/Ycf46/Vps4 family AAA+-type ATPase
MFGYQETIMRLSRLVQRCEEEAREKQAAGDLKAASECLRQAAEAARQMAREALRQNDRNALFAQARQYDEAADRLARGERALDRDRSAGKTVSADEEYKASVDELVCVARNVTWADIGGMEETKRTLKYMFGLMLARQPAGVRLPASSRVLLYGPPGTGKTLLAAACSNMLEATFYNVKASNMLSKWFGESTKLISALFARAREQTGPAVIFMDEIDGLCKEGEGDSTSGAERRIVSTFLAELDGMAEKGQPSHVIVIGATNRPWDLDGRMLQRFEKHVLVDLPDEAARKAIFRIHLDRAGVGLDREVSLDWLASRTDGYSGRNIDHVCKDAVESMVQDLNAGVPDHVDGKTIRDYEIRTRPLTRADFEPALKLARPLTSRDHLREYREWARRLER